MKKYLLIIICLLSNIVKAEKDSCTNVIVDSCTISNDSNLVTTNAESKPPTVNNNTKFKQPQKVLKASGIFDFVSDFFDIFLPPVWGYYTEEGQRSEGPYFLFDRKLDGSTYVQIQMERIREKIRITNSDEQKLYKQIFELAGISTISICDDADKFCRNTSRAKASAFVYLVGLDPDGVQLDGTGNFHGAIRQGYRNRALDFLNFVNAPGLNTFLDQLDYTGLGLTSVIDYISASISFFKMVDRATELQTICQAWDMLRWCYNIDPNLPNDNDIHADLVNAGKRIKYTYY